MHSIPPGIPAVSEGQILAQTIILKMIAQTLISPEICERMLQSALAQVAQAEQIERPQTDEPIENHRRRIKELVSEATETLNFVFFDHLADPRGNSN